MTNKFNILSSLAIGRGFSRDTPTFIPGAVHHRGGMVIAGIVVMGLISLLSSPLASAPRPPLGSVNDMMVLDRLMTTFVVRHRIPGGALAITRGGRLVYARGFGLADRARKLPVTPRSLFRIASVSKPFTAVSILQLADQGRLELDAPAMAFLAEDLKNVPGDERLPTITVRHLLEHRAGWDRVQSRFFPLRTSSLMRICRESGVPPPGEPETVVRYMLAQPLDFPPGERFAYSNAGYLILGRIIEAVSGESYPDYVQHHVLQPMGIQDMRIGGSSPKDRAPAEVCYYTGFQATIEARFGTERGRRVPLPYARSIEVQEAAGGWLASVVDLARFVAALQSGSHSAPLRPETIRQMTTPSQWPPDRSTPEPYTGYGLGWYVEMDDRQRTIIHHTGHLPGSGAFMGWRSDGIGAAVLFNCDTTPGNFPLIPLFLKELSTVVDAVSPWPPTDLFPRYFPQDRIK